MKVGEQCNTRTISNISESLNESFFSNIKVNIMHSVD